MSLESLAWGHPTFAFSKKAPCVKGAPVKQVGDCYTVILQEL